ncbi:MAG: hypothetical protein IKG92_08500 [Bacteroidales bacterium]|nr:hypothetical protein [Bacteroidales bacterium]
MYRYESPAETAFLRMTPSYHMYTKALESDVFFNSDDERAIAVNYMAISVMETGCTMLAYAIMTNHFHFVLAGSKERCVSFYERFKQLMDNYFAHHERGHLMKSVTCGITPIKNLQQMQTEIAYVVRNAFVVRPEVNVFADPWSTAFLYFNPLLVKEGVSASTLKGRALRAFTCSRMLETVDPRIYVKDGMAQPWSFVDYELVMSLYDSARQFIYSILKNVEALTEVSLRYGEDSALNDEELRPIVIAMSKKVFGEDYIFKLTLQQKKELAVKVKNQYHSSNKQLARIIRLAQADVDALFPLAAKR